MIIKADLSKLNSPFAQPLLETSDDNCTTPLHSTAVKDDIHYYIWAGERLCLSAFLGVALGIW